MRKSALRLLMVSAVCGSSALACGDGFSSHAGTGGSGAAAGATSTGGVGVGGTATGGLGTGGTESGGRSTGGIGGSGMGGVGHAGAIGTAGAIGPSGGTGGVVSSTTWCSLQPDHTLCSDFDSPEPLSKWYQQRSLGALTVLATTSASPPNSLDCKVVPNLASDTAMAFVWTTGNDPNFVVGEVTASFSVNVPQLPAQQTQIVVIGRVRFGTVYTELGWVSNQFEVFIDDVGDSSHTGRHIASYAIPSIPANKWNSISLTVVEGPNNNGSVGLSINGTNTQVASAVTTVVGDIASWGVDIGLVESGGVGAFVAYYDNVAIDRL